MEIIVLVIIITLICYAIGFVVEKIKDLFYISGPLFTFLANNIFAIAGLACFGLAVYVYIFYKPHPATRCIKSYKEGKITRGEAIEKIANTMYNPARDKIPSAYQSKILEKRINALRGRVKAETELMEDVIKYIKTKSRMD